MLLYNSIWRVGSLSQGLQAKKSGIRQVGFAPPALPLYSGRDVFPIKAMMMFRHLLTHFETLWGILSNFGQIWAILNHFEQLFRAGLGHFEQFWAFLSGKFGSCRAILSSFWKHDMALSTLDSVQMSQLRLLWDILLWLKKVADVNPTDLDPKTRSVNIYIAPVWYFLYSSMSRSVGFEKFDWIDSFSKNQQDCHVSPISIMPCSSRTGRSHGATGTQWTHWTQQQGRTKQDQCGASYSLVYTWK